jgi:hypothetical protein
LLIDDWCLAKVESEIRSGQSPIERRPLEPDTVSTVEGRNSHPMTVPSFSPERFLFGGRRQAERGTALDFK